MAASNDANTAEREIVITYTVNAPRDLVWEAWTRPEQISQWWGPNGFTITTLDMNVSVGGVWRFTMHGPNGRDYPNKIVYRELLRPERMLLDHSEDAPNPAYKFQVTVTFEEERGKTTVTLRQLYDRKEPRDAAVNFGAVELGRQTLAKLDAFLAQR